MSVRIGVIGTGWVVGKHLAALSKIEDARVVAIAGRNPTRVAELSKQTESAGYALNQLPEMLAREKLDAVLICTPPHVHGEIEELCAKYTQAVLIEKPISNNLETAKRCAEAFHSAGTLVSVGFMCRYRKSVARAREVLASGDPAVLVNGWWVGEMPPPLWWRTATQSGGQFVEQCTHMVDLARYLVGEIEEVSAYSTRGFIQDVPDYSVEDAAVVNVRFAGGAIGNFSTGCFTKTGHDSGLGIGLTIANRETKCVFSGWDVDLEITHTPQHKESVPSPEEDIFHAQALAFLQALKSGDHSLVASDYQDAIQTLRVGLAATRSAQKNRPVAPGQL